MGPGHDKDQCRSGRRRHSQRLFARTVLGIDMGMALREAGPQQAPLLPAAPQQESSPSLATRTARIAICVLGSGSPLRRLLRTFHLLRPVPVRSTLVGGVNHQISRKRNGPRPSGATPRGSLGGRSFRSRNTFRCSPFSYATLYCLKGSHYDRLANCRV